MHRRCLRGAMMPHGTAVSSALFTAGMASPLCTSTRNASWRTIIDPREWFGGKGKPDLANPDLMDSRGIAANVLNRETNPKLEEELPEIFANQPQEVEDYIRPDKSFFEKLEDVWDWVAGFFAPVDKQVDIMRSLKHDGLFGLDLGGWGGVFVFYGFVLRLLTLIPSLYSHRNALRMSHIGPQISEIQQQQQRAKNDRTLSTAEKRVVKEGLVRMKTALCKKHGCAQWKSFLQGMTAPVTLSAFMSIRRLAVYESDLEGSPFLWITDLTLPDPTNILPIICSGMFLMNFELNQRMQRGGRSSTGMYIRWAMRVGSVIFVYFFSAQPSAMFAYWIGLSSAGLVQPILLRNQMFRKMFNFPDPPQVAKEQMLRAEIKGMSWLEKLTATPEEKERKEKERLAKLAKLSEKKYQSIDEFEVVFEDNGKGKK